MSVTTVALQGNWKFGRWVGAVGKGCRNTITQSEVNLSFVDMANFMGKGSGREEGTKHLGICYEIAICQAKIQLWILYTK